MKGLTFADERLEEVYLIYTAEKNRGLTLRLHLLFTFGWLVAALKTVSQAFEAYGESEARSLPQLVLLMLAQLVNLVWQLKTCWVVSSLSRRSQLQQESSKAVLHVLMDMAVIVSLLLSDASLPHSPSPAPALAVGAFLLALDMVRLATFLRLMSIKWLCFILLEADQWARASQRSAKALAQDVLTAVGPGTALPLAVALLLELGQRKAFLHVCRRPLGALGPFWFPLHAALARLSACACLGAVATGARASLHED